MEVVQKRRILDRVDDRIVRQCCIDPGPVFPFENATNIGVLIVIINYAFLAS